MSKQEFAKPQSCVLKVDIQCQCDGCKKKVKKMLQKVDGVYTTKIDAEQGKVTVTGNVKPATLIKKLSKFGKHAELWVSHKGTNNFLHQFNNNQFKNFQIDAQKSGKDKKSQKDGGGGQQFQQQKGPKEMMKHQKSVKLDMNHEEYDASEDDFDDDFDDGFDEEDEDDHFHLQVPKGHQQFPNQMAQMGMMGNGNGPHGNQAMMNMINSHSKGGGGGCGGGVGKKGGAIDMPVSKKSIGGKNDSKHGNNGGVGFDGGKKGKGGNDKKQGGKDRNGGKGSDTDGIQDMKKMKNEFEIDVGKPGKGPKGGGGNHGGGIGTKSMGHMGPMAGGQIGQVSNFEQMGTKPAAVQGVALNGGYYPGMGRGPGNPYIAQQQQYMPMNIMMMNQQNPNMMSDMYRYPARNYVQPPPMPLFPDAYTNFFSDENTGSCRIM